jgi:hypothetical protein
MRRKVPAATMRPRRPEQGGDDRARLDAQLDGAGT